MSLLVSPYVRDPVSGEISWLECAYPDKVNDLAGFEVYRKILWGSQAMSALDFELLPTLVEYDILAEGKWLDELEKEARMLAEKAAAVAAGTIHDESRVRFYARNILFAVEAARAAKGGIGGVSIA